MCVMPMRLTLAFKMAAAPPALLEWQALCTYGKYAKGYGGASVKHPYYCCTFRSMC